MFLNGLCREEIQWLYETEPLGSFNEFVRISARKGRIVFVAPKLKEWFFMPRKGSAKSEPKTVSGSMQWVNIALPETIEDDLHRWSPDDATLFAGLGQLVADGHSVGWKRASDGDGFMAYATGAYSDCPNSGKGLSAFAATEREAVMCLLWKHFYIAEGHWPDPSTTGGRKFR